MYVPGIEGLEPHPMGKSPGHEVNSLQNLQRPHLISHMGAVKIKVGVLLVGSNTTYEMRFGVY